MQINKLSATFGKLDGDTLELHGGAERYLRSQ